MTRPRLELQIAHSPLLRYGLAVLSVATALAVALLLERYHFREAAFPLFLLAIAITCWYAGVRPAILAVVFSSLAFDYFFTEPLYSFYVTRFEIPYYISFILFAALVIWFSAVRRRVERELLQSRLLDELRFDGVDAGGIDESWRQQPGSPVYATDFDAAGVKRALSQAIKERKPQWRATATSPGDFSKPA